MTASDRQSAPPAGRGQGTNGTSPRAESPLTGASTAFHLAQRGLSVTVLEQGTAGSAATGRSSGLVRMHYDLAAESALAWLSYGYFRDCRNALVATGGFVRTGFLRIVPPDWEAALRANVADHPYAALWR